MDGTLTSKWLDPNKNLNKISLGFEDILLLVGDGFIENAEMNRKYHENSETKK